VKVPDKECSREFGTLIRGPKRTRGCVKLSIILISFYLFPHDEDRLPRSGILLVGVELIYHLLVRRKNIGGIRQLFYHQPAGRRK